MDKQYVIEFWHDSQFENITEFNCKKEIGEILNAGDVIWFCDSEGAEPYSDQPLTDDQLKDTFDIWLVVINKSISVGTDNTIRIAIECMSMNDLKTGQTKSEYKHVLV